MPPCGRLHDRAAGAAATHLDEEPRGDESQAAVLPVESVVVSIEGEVVQVEEPGQKGTEYQDVAMDRVNLSFCLPQLRSGLGHLAQGGADSHYQVIRIASLWTGLQQGKTMGRERTEGILDTRAQTPHGSNRILDPVRHRAAPREAQRGSSCLGGLERTRSSLPPETGTHSENTAQRNEVPASSHLSQCLLLVLVWQQIASYWSASHTMRMM